MNLLLLNGILENFDDLDLRLHHRAQLQAAGLSDIIHLCRSFNFDAIDKQIAVLEQLLEEDERQLKEQMDQKVLQSYGDPADVYEALRTRTADSAASKYFLSMMQHLLLIREEGPALTHYYQLLDGIVTDVVLDKKLAGAEGRLGTSVAKLVASLNDADRTQGLEDELAAVRANAARLKLDKETLEDEVAQGGEGMVGRLKDELHRLEEKLGTLRATTSRLHGQLESQKAGYEEQIQQLEMQIMELFRMIKELGREAGGSVEHIIENGQGMDRKQLIDTLERHMQRTKTIDILEGHKGGKRRKKKLPDGQEVSGDEFEEEEGTPRKGSVKRSNGVSTHRSTKGSKTPRMSEGPNGRTSQFMDADEAEVEEHMQQQLAAGVAVVSRPVIASNVRLIKFQSTLLATSPFRVRGASRALRGGDAMDHPILELQTDYSDCQQRTAWTTATRALRPLMLTTSTATARLPGRKLCPHPLTVLRHQMP